MIKRIITLFKRASFKTKIFIHFSLIIFITAIIFTITINFFEQQLVKKHFDNLTTIREIKKHQIEDYFHNVEKELATISSIPFVLSAARDLANTYESNGYQQQYKKYNKLFKQYLQYKNFENLFLIDVKSDHIIYSMNNILKNNTHSHISDKIYEKSNLQQLYYSMIIDKGFLKLVDFDFFKASNGEPAAFYATPVFDENLNMLAVLILQISIEKIDKIMTSNKKWKEEGLGDTGETYLVGENCSMRNNSRFFIEDKENYFSQIRRNGTSEETIKNIKKYNTNILLQKIDKSLCEKLFQTRQSGVDIRDDYRGVEVLSAYTTVDIEGVNWFILSEKDKAEAFELINYLKKVGFLTLFILVVILIITSQLFTTAISKPLEEIIKAFEDLGKGNLSKRLKINSTSEFCKLSTSYNKALDDLEKLSYSVEKLSILSSTDYLTKIYNRQKFLKELKNNIKRVKRTKENLSLAMIDIDFFKKINDTYGHSAGDEVLKEFCTIIKNQLRDIDIFARWGGEEFIILFINTNLNQAKSAAEKIRKKIEENSFENIKNITCSIGITQYKSEDTIHSFIENSDKALYKAKQKGRNNVSY